MRRKQTARPLFLPFDPRATVTALFTVSIVWSPTVRLVGRRLQAGGGSAKPTLVRLTGSPRGAAA